MSIAVVTDSLVLQESPTFCSCKTLVQIGENPLARTALKSKNGGRRLNGRIEIEMKLRNLFSLRRCFIFVSALWIAYSLIVSWKGTCEYYVGQKNGGWHLLYNEEGYEISDHGPVSEKEANRILEEYQIQASEWMNSYGTIYRYSNGDGSISFILIMIAPLAALYLLDKWHYRFEID